MQRSKWHQSAARNGPVNPGNVIKTIPTGRFKIGNNGSRSQSALTAAFVVPYARPSPIRADGQAASALLSTF
jgi:hypothetical protein